MNDELLIETNGDVLILTLNRPDALNAMTTSMLSKMKDIFDDQVNSRSARAILIRANGRGFCAGADVMGFAAAKGPEGALDGLRDAVNPLMVSMQNCPVPILAAVNGPVAGAAIGFVLSCDIIVGGEAASFTGGFGGLGLVPDAGGSQLLTNVVGPVRAKTIFLMNQTITADQALEWGMLAEVVVDEALQDHVMTMARKVAAGPTIAFGGTKQLVNTAGQRSLEEQLQAEYEGQVRMFATSDIQEGITAFAQRRPPVFKGQ